MGSCSSKIPERQAVTFVQREPDGNFFATTVLNPTSPIIKIAREGKKLLAENFRTIPIARGQIVKMVNGEAVEAREYNFSSPKHTPVKNL